MRKRDNKETDQENAKRAYDLLLNFIASYESKIEPSLWVGPMIGVLIQNYENSEVPFSLCKQELIDAIDHYKY